MTEHVVVTDEDATRVITLRRPEKKNALTPEMYAAMSNAIDTAQNNPAIRCLIITGGSGVFTAGNDLDDFLKASGSAQGEARPLNAVKFLHSLVHNTKPIIAAADGYCAAVLVGTSPAFGDSRGEFQKKFIADRLGPLEAGATMPELAVSIVDGIMGPNPDASGRALAIDTMAATPASTYRAAIKCIVTFDERANLPNIGVPVLCLVGEHDRNAPPPMMERMAAKIHGARYVCLPGAGHLPNVETPAAFNAAVLALLLDTQSAARA